MNCCFCCGSSDTCVRVRVPYRVVYATSHERCVFLDTGESRADEGAQGAQRCLCHHGPNGELFTITIARMVKSDNPPYLLHMYMFVMFAHALLRHGSVGVSSR